MPKGRRTGLPESGQAASRIWKVAQTTPVGRRRTRKQQRAGAILPNQRAPAGLRRRRYPKMTICDVSRGATAARSRIRCAAWGWPVPASVSRYNRRGILRISGSVHAAIGQIPNGIEHQLRLVQIAGNRGALQPARAHDRNRELADGESSLGEAPTDLSVGRP